MLAEAEAFATREYPWALARGARLSTEERADAVARLARIAGVSEDYVDRVDLRIEHIRFFHRGAARPAAHRRPAGRALPRLGRGLRPGAHVGRPVDLPYEVLSERVQPWSFKEFEGQHVNVAGRLAATLRANPSMRVHIAAGYYDGACPYFAAEHSIAHLGLSEELRGNVEFQYFEAGHMMYVHEPSRLAQSAQLAEFVSPAR